MAVADVTEFRAYLNKPTGGDDAELQEFLDRAQVTIEKRVGPLEPVTIENEEHEFPRSVVLPRKVPVLSVQSITAYPGATVIPPRDLAAGTDGYRLEGWEIYYAFTPDVTTVLVSYTAGRADLSADLKQAVLELATHDWRSTQIKRPGATITGMGEAAPNVTPHLLPYRVEELIQYDLLPPKVA